jgi:hypothetical protein
VPRATAPASEGEPALAYASVDRFGAFCKALDEIVDLIAEAATSSDRKWIETIETDIAPAGFASRASVTQTRYAGRGSSPPPLQLAESRLHRLLETRIRLELE